MEKHNQLWTLYQQTYFRWSCKRLQANCFFIISARNPEGETLCDKENCEKHHSFEQELKRRELRFKPLLAGNIDFSYQEPSFAVLTNEQVAISMAQQLAQLAIFSVVDDGLYLLPTNMPGFNKTFVAPFSERLK